jgi:hypothetical protein
MLMKDKKIRKFKKQHPNCYIALTKKQQSIKAANVNTMLQSIKKFIKIILAY